MKRRHRGKSVVRAWVADECSFKEQAVLLSALRGCDGVHKEDLSKQFVRKLRSMVLYPAVTNIMSASISNFMKADVTYDDMREFCAQLDHYPMHWLLHFAHACQIIGYRYPGPEASFWKALYMTIVRDGLHLCPESPAQIAERLGDPEVWYPIGVDLETRE